MPQIRRLLPAAAVLLASAASIAPAPGQVEVGIVAVVNDEAVSAFDLEQRLAVAISTSQLPNTPETRERLAPQALRAIVDERLELQEAARLNIQVTAAEIDAALRSVEANNRLPPGGIGAFLAERGLQLSAVQSQIRAEIAWAKIVRIQIAPSVTISDDEIDAEMARLQASQGRHRVLLSEIFLAVDSPQRDSEVREQIERLAGNVRDGAPFAAVARQFSQGSSAISSGDVGWVLEDQLASEIAAIVSGMDIGQVSNPVAAAGGYYLVLLRDREVIGEVDDREIRVHLKQVALPLVANAPPPDVARALARAETIAATVRGCDAMDAMIQEVGNLQSGDLGDLLLGDMPARFREAVARLELGVPSTPVRSDAGVHVFMVCDREVPEANIPSREEVAEGLFDQRIDMLTRRYRRDLRRDAVIEYR